jgi:Bacterial Ig-like domain (group 3)
LSTARLSSDHRLNRLELITMKRTLTSLAALTAVAAGLFIGGVGAASAATAPPWEPDSSSVGGLTFYNAAGHVITGGSVATAPIAAYVEGSKAVRAGDTKATLFGFKPVAHQDPTQWSGAQLSASTAYPNSAAPAPLKTATLPVVTGSSGDLSVAQLKAEYPTTSTAGYANIYQIRLLTSAPLESISQTYDSADILVIGSTWSQIYPHVGTTTKTTLKTSKTSIVFGGKVTLTATVSPATAKGTIDFLAGTKLVKAVAVSGGKAKLATKALPGGTQKVTAVYAPTGTSGFATSTSTVHKVKVKAHTTKVTAKSSVSAGKKLKLTIKVSPKVSGKVTILNGSKKLGTAKITKGKGTFSSSKLSKGSHTLTVKFTATEKADYAKSTRKVTVKITK